MCDLRSNLPTLPVLLGIVVALPRKLGAFLGQQEAPRYGVVALQVMGAQHVRLKVLVRWAVVEPFIDNLMGEVRKAA